EQDWDVGGLAAEQICAAYCCGNLNFSVPRLGPLICPAVSIELLTYISPVLLLAPVVLALESDDAGGGLGHHGTTTSVLGVEWTCLKFPFPTTVTPGQWPSSDRQVSCKERFEVQPRPTG